MRYIYKERGEPKTHLKAKNVILVVFNSWCFCKEQLKINENDEIRGINTNSGIRYFGLEDTIVLYYED